jgi:glycosyltransferase involved in cell wall biosynthesis
MLHQQLGISLVLNIILGICLSFCIFHNGYLFCNCKYPRKPTLNMGNKVHKNPQLPCSTPLGLTGFPFCEINLNMSGNLIQGGITSYSRLDGAILISDTSPIYSVILTVYNQGDILSSNLDSLLRHTSGPWELIVLLDGCQDNSKKEALDTLENWIAHKSSYCVGETRENSCNYDCMVRVQVIEHPDPIDETASNNVGMLAADPRTSYFVLIQADMRISEPGWNVALSIPFRVWPDVFSVSARCAHDFAGTRFVGLCSSDINNGFGPMGLEQRRVFAVRQTCNRGPLMLHAKRTAQLGYLDEVGHYRGDDDHDLNARAWHMGRWVSGFYPIQFNAPLKDGATRRVRPHGLAQEQEDLAMKARVELASKSPSFLNRISNFGGFGTFGGPDENRSLPDELLKQFLCVP